MEALKEENDSLRWQLDAYRNEVELLKQEQGKASRDEDTTKEQQMKLLQQALQGMQKVGPDFSIAMAWLQRQRGHGAELEHQQRRFVFQWHQNWQTGATFCHFQCCQKKPTPNNQMFKTVTVYELISHMETIHSLWIPGVLFA